MNKNVIDCLDPKDSIKGYVYIYRDGKLIIEGHNLIVNTGRQFVKDIFMNSAFASININEEDTGTKYTNYKFYKAYFGKTGVNTFVTQENTTFESVKTSAIESLTKNLGIIGTSTENTAVIYSDFASRKFRFEMEINGTADNIVSISEIFLTIKEYNTTENAFSQGDDTEVLFSRFVFDPIFIGSNSNCKIVYYIAF